MFKAQQKEILFLKGNCFISKGQITSSKNNWVIKKITFYLAYFIFMKLFHTLQKCRTRCFYWLKQENFWGRHGSSCLKSQHLGGWGRNMGVQVILRYIISLRSAWDLDTLSLGAGYGEVKLCVWENFRANWIFCYCDSGDVTSNFLKPHT